MKHLLLALLMALPMSSFAQMSATKAESSGTQRYIVRLKDSVHGRGDREPLQGVRKGSGLMIRFARPW